MTSINIIQVKMDNKNLKKLQSLELEIAKELKKICDENNIKYFLICGTMLGAVRHHGFIPWDDDMDFGMIRSEYEKFIEICKTNLDSRFYLQTWDTDENFPFSYGKLRLNNTYIKEEFADGVILKHKGVFIDIFPFDNAPNSKVLRYIHGIHIKVNSKALWIKKGFGRCILQEGFISKIKYYLFKCLVSPFNYDKLKKRQSKLIEKYNNKSCKYIVMNCVYSYEKSLIAKELVFNLTSYIFENQNFLGIKNFDFYLSHLFGNYMQLPPKEQQKNHGISEFDFGEY